MSSVTDEGPSESRDRLSEALRRLVLAVREDVIAEGLEADAEALDVASARGDRPVDRERVWALEALAAGRRLRAARLRADSEDALLLVWGGDPDHADANAALASLYRARHERAEDAGDRLDAVRWERRLRRHDKAGRHADWLDGTGQLTVRVAAPDVEVWAEPMRTERPVWAPGPAVHLGAAPVENARLAAGPHRLRLRRTGREDVVVPVRVLRAECSTLDALTLPERDDDEFVHVSAGTFVYGGDPEGDYPLPQSRPFLPGFDVARFPVTLGEYVVFLNDLFRRDPDQALHRVPRRPAPGGPRALLRARRDRAEPFDTADLDPLSNESVHDHAATGISHGDASAFSAWRSLRDGVTYRLPSEREWEKAARGTDGRIFPWGDRFDSSLCHMRYTRPGRPRPAPVGFVDTDESPYGVRDMAGGVLEWCRPGSDPMPGDGMPIRGGCWHSSARPCRAADRFGAGPDYVDPALGFRLVRAVD